MKIILSKLIVLLTLFSMPLHAEIVNPEPQYGMRLGRNNEYANNIEYAEIIGNYFIGISYGMELFIGEINNLNEDKIKIKIDKTPIILYGDTKYVSTSGISCAQFARESKCILTTNSEKGFATISLDLSTKELNHLSDGFAIKPYITGANSYFVAEIDAKDGLTVSQYNILGDKIVWGSRINPSDKLKYINIGVPTPLPVAVSSGVMKLLLPHLVNSSSNIISAPNENQWISSKTGFYTNLPWHSIINKSKGRTSSINKWGLQRGSNGIPELVNNGEYRYYYGDNALFDDKITTDNNGNIYAIYGTSKGATIGMFCKNKDSSNNTDYALKDIMNFKNGEALNFQFSPQSSVALISAEAPDAAPNFKIISFGENKNYTDLPCNEINPKIKDVILNNVKDTKNQVNTQHKIRLDTGAELYFDKNLPVAQSLIINVYGASALETTNSFKPHFIPDDNKTSIGWAIVRGDANFGVDFALSASAPNRNYSYEDLNNLVKLLLNKYPKLKGKITLRGISSGAWVASMAAIKEPDLYSGVIGISGAYNYKDLLEEKDIFLSADDNVSAILDGIKDGCGGISFRLIHAKDDFTTPISQAISFKNALEAKKCKVELVEFETGEHSIAVSRLIGEHYNKIRALRDNAVSMPIKR